MLRSTSENDTLPGKPTSVSVRQLLPTLGPNEYEENADSSSSGRPSPYCSGCRKSQIDSSIGRWLAFASIAAWNAE
jgi:hypothetical protein